MKKRRKQGADKVGEIEASMDWTPKEVEEQFW